MHIYVKNIPPESHPDPFWNDGASGFFEEVARPNKQKKNDKNNKNSSEVRSVPDLKWEISHSFIQQQR